MEIHMYMTLYSQQYQRSAAGDWYVTINGSLDEMSHNFTNQSTG